MIWVVSLVIALVAYFIFQGLHARHISRCNTDDRTAEHVPASIRNAKAQNEFHKKSAATAKAQSKQLPAPHGAPSLLYADKPATARHQGQHGDQTHELDEQQTADSSDQESPSQSGLSHSAADIVDMDLDANQTIDRTLETMEFTAEHAPLDHSDVGTPANNAEYTPNDPAKNEPGPGIAAVGVAAATAASIAAANPTRACEIDANFEDENTALHNASAGPSEDIDVELGDSDSTYNDAVDMDGKNHDELLDFGDLTTDISDMLKELNLRETDSPRLEINKAEFEQLKTGDPGEVQPAKIENVADKLRNMLQ